MFWCGWSAGIIDATNLFYLLSLQAAPHSYKPPPPLPGSLWFLCGSQYVLSKYARRWLLVSWWPHVCLVLCFRHSCYFCLSRNHGAHFSWPLCGHLWSSSLSHDNGIMKRVQTCVLMCWICSLLVVGVLLKDNLDKPGRFNSCFGECVIYVDFAIQVTDLILTILLPITVIVILYVRVFAVAVFQIRAMQPHVPAVTQRGKVSPKKSELKAARTLGIVIVAFLICLFPYYSVILSGQDTLLDILSVTFFLCLFYFNSCLNPIIYAFFYPWFRKSVKLIVTFQIVKSGSSDASMLWLK